MLPKCRQSVAKVLPKCQKCQESVNFCGLADLRVFSSTKTRSGVSKSVNFCGLADLRVFSSTKTRSGVSKSVNFCGLADLRVFSSTKTRSGPSKSVNFCGLADLRVFSSTKTRPGVSKSVDFCGLRHYCGALSMKTWEKVSKNVGTPHVRKRHFGDAGDTTGDTPTDLNIRRPKFLVLGLRARYNSSLGFGPETKVHPAIVVNHSCDTRMAELGRATTNFSCLRTHRLELWDQ